jgi:hypothetical protein
MVAFHKVKVVNEPIKPLGATKLEYGDEERRKNQRECMKQSPPGDDEGARNLSRKTPPSLLLLINGVTTL